jgi:glycine amidinotransferase
MKSNPVNSWNEWDPLEEVIVGVVEGACVPTAWARMEARQADEDEFGASAVQRLWAAYAGRPYPWEVLRPIRDQVENLVKILKSEGIVVRRPEPFDWTRPVSTPFFVEYQGFNFGNPRDLLLVIGDEIIETPSADRNRYFETFAYRSLLMHYFKQGARWTSAPRPTLRDACYDPTYLVDPPKPGDRRRYHTTELEPLFDAADFIRCGRDLFFIRSATTNYVGVEWLRRHLGEQFRLHEIITHDPHPIHIDTTFLPLGPGKAMINPEWVVRNELPAVLKGWDILEAQVSGAAPVDVHGFPIATSPWIGLNVLLLDDKRILVERREERLIAAFRDWGFEPIPLAFSLPPLLGGGLHCFTLDIRRRGTLQSYL